jgi:hypothetical protein
MKRKGELVFLDLQRQDSIDVVAVLKEYVKALEIARDICGESMRKAADIVSADLETGKYVAYTNVINGLKDLITEVELDTN